MPRSQKRIADTRIELRPYTLEVLARRSSQLDQARRVALAAASVLLIAQKRIAQPGGPGRMQHAVGETRSDLLLDRIVEV